MSLTLLIVEGGLRFTLGNVEISRFDLEPADGRCVALMPGEQVTYTGWAWRIPAVVHATNSAGYRGVERPLRKPGGVLRILAIGDSTTYGQGCAAEHAFPAFLERDLSLPTAPVEVLNFGVPGYNIEEYRDQYDYFASQWEHDVVLVTLSPNDLDPPLCSMLGNARMLWLIKHIYLVRAAYVLLFRGAFFGADEEPAADASRVRGVLGDIAERSRRQGAASVVVDRANGWHEALTGTPVRQIAGELGVPYFDLDSCSSIGGAPVSFSTIPGDGHRDPEGNCRAAHCIARFLAQEGLVGAQAGLAAANDSSASGCDAWR